MAEGDDQQLVEALNNGSEAAFVSLFKQYHAALIRVAMIYVHERGIAEEVAQETWLSVLRGLARFEGRSSLKTWIFRILVNRAKTRGRREGRTIPFADLSPCATEMGQVAVAASRFHPIGHRWAGHWASPPQSWPNLIDEQLLQQEVEALIRRTIETLHPNQRIVITLRDLEGWSPRETCAVLEITESSQRVLLHRARAKVRRALEQYLDEPD